MSTVSSRTSHLLLLTLLAVAARARVFLHPEDAITGFRQTDLGGVVLTYLQDGPRLWHPQVLWGGVQDGFVEMEWPLLPWLVARADLLAGERAWFGAVVPVASALVAALALSALVARFRGPREALLAGALFAVSPSFASWSASLVSDPTMVAGAILAVHLFARWAEEGGAWRLCGSSAALALALLLKPTAGVVAVPLMWLAWRRDGWGFLRRPGSWGYALAALLPPVLWYAHAYDLGATYGHSYGVLSGGYNKLAHWDLLVTSAFYTRLAERLVVYHLTPVAAVAAVVEVFRRGAVGREALFHVWLAAGLAGGLAVPEGTHQMLQYHYLLLPPLCAFAAGGLLRLDAWGCARAHRVRAPAALASLLLAAAVVGGVAVATLAHAARADSVVGGRRLRAGALALAPALRDAGAIVFVSRDLSGGALDGPLPGVVLPRGQHMTPPDYFYFLRRRGWFIAVPWLTVAEIEARRAEGAHYLVVGEYVGDDVAAFRVRAAPVAAYLDAHYRRIVETPRAVVYDLSAGVPGAPRSRTPPS